MTRQTEPHEGEGNELQDVNEGSGLTSIEATQTAENVRGIPAV